MFGVLRGIIRQGLLVAVQAPAHLLPVLAAHPHHGLHRPVALLARDLRCQVPAMVEVGEVSQVVYLLPDDRPLLFPVIDERLHRRGQLAIVILVLDLLVALHAGGHRRNRRLGPGFGLRVAVQAVDLQLAGVERVAVLDRLHRLVSRLPPRWPEDGGPESHTQSPGEQEHGQGHVHPASEFACEHWCS